MSDDWYYAQNNERKGPVSFGKLKAMADSGWLAPDDLVWNAGLKDWLFAKDADGLFTNPLGRVLRQTITGLRGRRSLALTQASVPDSGPPVLSASPVKNPRGKFTRPSWEIDWVDLTPRHVIAGCGGFLAALGIAFTAIAKSPLALAFTLSGLVIAAAGFYVEIGRLLGQAIENIGKASKEAADRRLRAQELAVEKQKLELEAARLAQEQTARHAQSTSPTALAPHHSQQGPASHSGNGQVVVINQPPVQLWSPGIAAVLSFFVPGLGQVYKGQAINGIFWFIFVGMGYVALILPGLVLHFFCVLGALSGNPWTEGKTTAVRQ